MTNVQKYLPWIVLIALLFMPLFGHLDSAPIRIWDEARNAENAYAMTQTGNPIVTYCDGEVDYWNTKPPLLIWVQVIFIHILGYNELAIRLPSALAGLVLCLSLVYFSKKYLQDAWFGFITTLLLICCGGFVCFHGTRSGDYDTLLTLFTTGFGLSLFVYLETNRSRYMMLCTTFLTLAILTKGITGLIFIPGFFVYLLITKNLIRILKNRSFYLALAIPVIFAGGYYLLREWMDPGYISHVQINELGGRFLDAAELHQEPFWYYFDQIISRENPIWLSLILIGLFLGFLSQDPKIRRLTLFSSISGLSFLLIVSAAQTKLFWYSIPIYPYIAIVMAVGVYTIFNTLKSATSIPVKIPQGAIAYVMLFLLFIYPYKNLLGKTYQDHETADTEIFYEMSYYLKLAAEGKKDLSNFVVVHEGYAIHLLFYIRQLNLQGVNTELKRKEELAPGDRVLFNQPEVKQYIEATYVYDKTDSSKTILTYHLHATK